MIIIKELEQKEAGDLITGGCCDGGVGGGGGGGVLIQPPDEPRGSVCSPKLPPAMSPLLRSRRLPFITFLLCRCGSR